MPERIQAILNKVVAWWKKFNTKQRTLMISAVAVVIVALVILAVVLSRPTKVELVEAESASDASSIKNVLEDNNITYDVDSNLVFYVNKSDEVNAIMALGCFTRRAVAVSEQTAARIPLTLLAAIEIPTPVPHISIPQSNSPDATALATLSPYSG